MAKLHIYVLLLVFPVLLLALFICFIPELHFLTRTSLFLFMLQTLVRVCLHGLFSMAYAIRYVHGLIFRYYFHSPYMHIYTIAIVGKPSTVVCYLLELPLLQFASKLLIIYIIGFVIYTIENQFLLLSKFNL